MSWQGDGITQTGQREWQSKETEDACIPDTTELLHYPRLTYGRTAVTRERKINLSRVRAVICGLPVGGGGFGLERMTSGAMAMRRGEVGSRDTPTGPGT